MKRFFLLLLVCIQSFAMAEVSIQDVEEEIIESGFLCLGMGRQISNASRYEKGEMTKAKIIKALEGEYLEYFQLLQIDKEENYFCYSILESVGDRAEKIYNGER
ncbi:hypothetical protein [Helicobacter sp. MIT 05-5294]|uniref:hypothetical protein n=1 Tax=Helicobacter sp. MIT 05-5294 TaxID=1548150 RepID=UPI00051FAE29|nr:hypothetical protein [Helicobacter sp. MIT 05-5294]TLD85822.1 hypothetical protein LS69_007960 [Helicobacter sp. MIT 05-5294]